MDLSKCNGRPFRCKIKGTPVKGKIRVEDKEVYLCQDKCNGTSILNKFGFKHSWCITSGLEANYVTDFQLVPVTAEEIEAYKDWQVGDIVYNPSLGKPMSSKNCRKVIFRSGELVVLKYSDEVATRNYTCEELYNEGFRLFQPDIPQEKVELTMDEIAKKFNIPVEQLNIKKE